MPHWKSWLPYVAAKGICDSNAGPKNAANVSRTFCRVSSSSDAAVTRLMASAHDSSLLAEPLRPALFTSFGESVPMPSIIHRSSEGCDLVSVLAIG